MILMLACVAHQSLPPDSSMPLTGVLLVPTGIVDFSVHDPSEKCEHWLKILQFSAFVVVIMSFTSLLHYLIDY